MAGSRPRSRKPALVAQWTRSRTGAHPIFLNLDSMTEEETAMTSAGTQTQTTTDLDPEPRREAGETPTDATRSGESDEEDTARSRRARDEIRPAIARRRPKARRPRSRHRRARWSLTPRSRNAICFYSVLTGRHATFLPVVRRDRRNHASPSLRITSLAEREGFEPSVPLPVRQISNLVPSTTRPPLHRNKSSLFHGVSPCICCLASA
jgi:hypothetical protein